MSQLPETLKKKGFPNLGNILKGGAKIAGKVIKRHPVGGVLDDLGVLEGIGEALGIGPDERTIDKQLQSMTPEQLDTFLELKTLEAKAETQIAMERIAEIERVAEIHKNDMASDSKLSKNIRPVMLIALGVIAAVYSYLIIHASINGKLDELSDYSKQLLDSIQENIWWAFSLALNFYFGFREVGKAIVNWRRESK